MIVFDPSLEKRLLIEAGAGTGKTWTIAGLYVRLIVEKDYRVNKILVVTFTNAATEELRDRLRTRLVEAKQAFETGEGKDPFEQQLIESNQTELSIKRLTIAIRSFDQAAVFTIHSFCQRLLAETALQSGAGFEFELIGDAGEMMQSIVDDYWRKNFYQLTRDKLAMIQSKGMTPESLLADIKGWIGKPWLEVLPIEVICRHISIDDLAEEKQQLKHYWFSEKEEIRDVLNNAVGKTLSKASYKEADIPLKLQGLEVYLEGDDVLGLPDKSLLFTQSKLLASTNKNKESPEHLFFQQWEDYLANYHLFEENVTRNYGIERLKLLSYVRNHLQKMKAEKSQLGFDDLLLLLHEALYSPDGKTLAKTARQNYPVALVDEFQDTDQIQYEIFSAIYPNVDQPLFFVGDPKQAIYRFRGADIFTYLEAKKSTGSPLHLKQNFRSSESMVKAVNTLFDQHPDPFREVDIEYQDVSAGRGEEKENAAPKALGAMRIWNDYSTKTAKPKKVIEPQIVAAVADDIANLLNHSAEPDYQINGRNLRGGDIAVLVRKNKQGSLIKDALNSRNIGCVQQLRNNVFLSDESNELAKVLHALLPSARDNDYRAALATLIFGKDTNDLARYVEDTKKWDDWVDKFFNWRVLWQEQGFIQMIRALMFSENCYSRLLKYPSGERRLTNILHLAELIHKEGSRRVLSPESLLLWFNRQRQQFAENEEAQLRLESDENLVKIVTVHRSKGLQYGIVYCPFLWANAPDDPPANKKGSPFSFHDPARNNQPWLVLSAKEHSREKNYAYEEEFSENMRLLYVALTRAEYHCTIVSGRFNNMHKSALGWLLHGADLNSNELSWKEASELIKKKSIEDHQADIGGLVSHSNNSIYLEPLPENSSISYTSPFIDSKTLGVKKFERTLSESKRVTSYSSMTSGHASERPDYNYSSFSEDDPMDFFRGAEAGVCLHSILEELDFTSPLVDQSSLIIEPSLIRHGFTQALTEKTTTWLQDVLDTPLELDQSFSLSNIKAADRINELEFYYPLMDFNSNRLKQILNPFFKNSAIASAIERLNLKSVQGYLRGFVDLIYRKEDRYFLVDYKSNWLGKEIISYSKEALTDEIARSHYYLQYLIYMVALHRYLRTRLSDYQYTKNIGGVYYLFLRGMSPDSGAEFGIYRDLPPEALINALDEFFQTEGKV